MSQLSTIGIVPHLTRRLASDLADSTARELDRRGVRVVVPATDAALTGLEKWAVPDAEFGKDLSMVFSLGGDGTMLRAVHLVLSRDVPVLGVNVGHLGYLTSLVPDELPGALNELLAGQYDVDARMTLTVEVRRPGVGEVQTLHALNDAVVEKSSPGNTVRLGVSFNGRPFLDYSTDGLIVATPTGSTAYAFSVRGPIVSPTMDALIVVPVSPHMLFDRSLVLDGTESVTTTVLDGRAGTLFVDGRDCGLIPEGTTVTCIRGAVQARLVTFGDRDFYGRVTTKFALPIPGNAPARERFSHLSFDDSDERKGS
jgi:NAD+ kinase